MSAEEIRQKFLDFFRERGHVIVPSSSLLPGDPSVLLTTAGVQQFKPYYTGQLDPIKDFGSQNTVSIQRCFRATDIDEVGDDSHLTFFEMLGNFSFGGYFKREAIRYARDFIVGAAGLTVDYVTIFDPARVPDGDWRKNSVPFDDQSHRIWREEIGLPAEKIRRAGVDNFWGPTGGEGPCGPTTELYVKNAAGQSIEIWNIVFNQFYCDRHQRLTPLERFGVDTGMGLERLAMAAQGAATVFDTDIFSSLTALLPAEISLRSKRIIADHSRGVVRLIADGVRPSNKEAGYILRRLMRRLMVLGRGVDFAALLREALRAPEAVAVFEEENRLFLKTLERGLKELGRINGAIDTAAAFKLYESCGLPFEVIKELGGARAAGLRREEFDQEFKKHQEISRAGSERKFGGHGLLLNTGELRAGNEKELQQVLRLHTATHLLQQALRDTLGPEVRQAGSDITAERTRFDFTFGRKLTPEEIKKVEDGVNEIVAQDLPVSFEELSREEAMKTGALFFFKEKYPEQVKVYYVGRSLGGAYSKEFCGGPHVSHTGQIGKVKIVKEEAVGSGIRRIRAVVSGSLIHCIVL